MGNSTWNSSDWDRYSSKTSKQTTREIFNSSSLKNGMDPKKVTVRESRDSVKNPQATPIILALDVTGSMGMIADHLARKGLGTLVEHILDRKPVTDPHIMFMGVGDVNCDDAPLQVSQFEADIKIAEQLKDLYLEHGGGNNTSESYTLPWYFAAQKTDIDCVKHNRKGVLFTFGDEECPDSLTPAQIKKFIGDSVPSSLSAKELYKMVSEKYDVFHVVIEQGNYASSYKNAVYRSWEKVLPKDRIIAVDDYTKVPEVLVSVMQVYGGKPQEDVIKSWKGDTAATVRQAVKNVKPAENNGVIALPKPVTFKKQMPKNGTTG